MACLRAPSHWYLPWGSTFSCQNLWIYFDKLLTFSFCPCLPLLLLFLLLLLLFLFCLFVFYFVILYWFCHTSAAVKSLQLCPTLCDPADGSPPGSAIPGILQARTLEWVAISFSNAWMWKVKVKSLSRVRPSATPWTAAYQAPPSMGFSRYEYWSGVPLPSPYSLLVKH